MRGRILITFMIVFMIILLNAGRVLSSSLGFMGGQFRLKDSRLELHNLPRGIVSAVGEHGITGKIDVFGRFIYYEGNGVHEVSRDDLGEHIRERRAISIESSTFLGGIKSSILSSGRGLIAGMNPFTRLGLGINYSFARTSNNLDGTGFEFMSDQSDKSIELAFLIGLGAEIPLWRRIKISGEYNYLWVESLGGAEPPNSIDLSGSMVLMGINFQVVSKQD